MPEAHRVRLSVDYFVRWPVKVDGLYDEDVKTRISPGLRAELEEAADWWQETHAVPMTDPPTQPDFAAIQRWQVWKRDLLERLSSELGEGYVPDHS